MSLCTFISWCVLCIYKSKTNVCLSFYLLSSKEYCSILVTAPFPKNKFGKIFLLVQRKCMMYPFYHAIVTCNKYISKTCLLFDGTFNGEDTSFCLGTNLNTKKPNTMENKIIAEASNVCRQTSEPLNCQDIRQIKIQDRTLNKIRYNTNLIIILVLQQLFEN